MSLQIINVGQSANDKSGDPLRSAFIKINANFTELYATTSADVQIPAQTNNNGKYLTTNGTSLSWGTISTTTNQLVNGAHTVTVGSDGYLTVESLYVQGYLKGVDGSTGSTGQVLTRQSNGGVAWANATGGTVDRLVNGDFNFILGPDGTVNFDPSSANGKGILQTAADLQFIAVDKTWTFDKSGTINTPLFFPKTFTALLLPVYGGGTDGPYGGNAWEIGVTFSADADGIVTTSVDNIFPILNNPGYKNGDSWTFHEADHGIPGYTFTLALGNVVLPGGAGWTATVLASESPEYTPTVKSDGAIKLTADTSNWTFGSDGKLTFPDSTVQTTAWTGNAATVTNGVYLTDTQTLTNKTLTSPTITDGVFQDTFSIGNQVFYEHGYNGFSVNENYDIVGEGNFTGYHFTSGAGRDGVAFTLARTGQFTTGFGIHGTAEANEYVIGSETTNTDFVFKKSIGMPFDVSGGTDLFRISNDGSITFSDATVQTTAALPYVKSTFTGGTATLDIFTATWTNSGGPIRLQISVSNTVNVTLQYTATSIIAGTTTSTDGGGIWTQPPNNPPFSSNNLDNLGDIQVMYLQDITNQKIYRITGMNTAGNVNPAQGSVLIERII